MIDNPYESSEEQPESGLEPEPPQTDRERFNRIIGLSCLAVAAVMLGLIVLGVYDDLHTKGLPGLKADLQNLGLLCAAAFVLAALGYTSRRRPRK
jgi:hypothetical protein